jgi:hypothetical protein
MIYKIKTLVSADSINRNMTADEFNIPHLAK